MDAGEDVGEALAAGRPAPLLEVLPQERVQQRIVEQIVDPVPLVPLLHEVVPQMVEQLVDFLSPLDFPIAEQVIEVPNIVCPPRAARTVLSAPQTVEQLVEVPTPVSYSSLLQRTMEQHVDIPVPLGSGGRHADLQGFLRGQSSTTLSSQERISERIVEQFVQFPAEGLQDFRPGQSSPASSSFVSPAGSDDDANELGQRVFRTFPQNKKKSAMSGPHSRSELLPESSPSTRRADAVPMVPEVAAPRVRLKEWVLILNEHGLNYWNMDTGEGRWQMEDGLDPRWWLRDGQYVDLDDN